MTVHYENHAIAAKNLFQQLDNRVVIAVPLGIGKPIGLLNAMYRLAEADQSIQLTIITGLTLARPSLHNGLEKLFVRPLLDRLLKDYEDPLYEEARMRQALPTNIRVVEFFLSPGKYTHNNYVQQNYISSNYTNVVRDLAHFSVNVIGQQVARSKTNPELYSLSCNTDLFHQAAHSLHKKKSAGEKIAIVAEVNLNLPYMGGSDAEVAAAAFTDIVDTGHYPALFAVPREKLSAQDYLIGFYTSCLVKDDGCLQIGIGKLSNAVASALILRQQQNAVYQDLLGKLLVEKKFPEAIGATGGVLPFHAGLYASTEMMSDEYIQLYHAGILKKRVYDHVGLQQLLNLHLITEHITPAIIDVLLTHKLINAQLSADDVAFLQLYGVFNTKVTFQAGNLILASGEKIIADLTVEDTKQKVLATCLGTKLLTGKIMHAGFFLGSAEFYKQLNNLPPAELAQFEMTTIARTNTLSWSPALATLQRQHARLINSAMMVTLGGTVISDGVVDLQEISGVGGQFNFVNMAQNLEGARAIINCRSTRQTMKGIESNIIWDYANVTIPRHMRDIVVTEYGIADCRSKTDAEIIQTILNITDSRFQNALLAKAKQFGKIPQSYVIPKLFQQNTPAAIEGLVADLQSQGYCPPYPFGSELTAEEQVLEDALLFLKNCSAFKLVGLTIRAWFYLGNKNQYNIYLERMQLSRPKNLSEHIYKKLLIFVIHLNKD